MTTARASASVSLKQAFKQGREEPAVVFESGCGEINCGDAGPGRLPVLTFRPGSPRRSPSRRLPLTGEKNASTKASQPKNNVRTMRPSWQRVRRLCSDSSMVRSVNFRIKFSLFQNFLEIENPPAAGGTFCNMKLKQLPHLGAQPVRPYFVAEEIQQCLCTPRRFMEPHRFLRAPIKAVSVATADQPIFY